VTVLLKATLPSTTLCLSMERRKGGGGKDRVVLPECSLSLSYAGNFQEGGEKEGYGNFVGRGGEGEGRAFLTSQGLTFTYKQARKKRRGGGPARRRLFVGEGREGERRIRTRDRFKGPLGMGFWFAAGERKRRKRRERGGGATVDRSPRDEGERRSGRRRNCLYCPEQGGEGGKEKVSQAGNLGGVDRRKGKEGGEGEQIMLSACFRRSAVWSKEEGREMSHLFPRGHRQLGGSLSPFFGERGRGGGGELV